MAVIGLAALDEKNFIAVRLMVFILYLYFYEIILNKLRGNKGGSTATPAPRDPSAPFETD